MVVGMVFQFEGAKCLDIQAVLVGYVTEEMIEAEVI